MNFFLLQLTDTLAVDFHVSFPAQAFKASQGVSAFGFVVRTNVLS